MKNKKERENKPKDLAQNTENIWKSKAAEKSVTIKALNKKIKELKISRDLWKSKYKNQNLVEPKNLNFEPIKAKYHQYCLQIVTWMLCMQSYGGMSLRGCSHSIATLYLVLALKGRVPCAATIRNWACKHGYYRVKTAGDDGGDMVIYVDESIILGGEKILLVLGIPYQKIPTKRSVNQVDIRILFIGYAKEWKGKEIACILKRINDKNKIKYAVSDQGTNLKTAYSISELTHIEDCTHIFSNNLKKIYEKLDLFCCFSTMIGQLRKKWCLSKENSGFMPPSMRGKLRFANIFPCINWAKKQLDNWGNLPESVSKSLTCLKENQAFIDELVEISELFKSVCSTLKNKGFGAEQKLAILKELATKSKNERILTFTQNIKDYLDNLTQKSEKIGEKFLLCSSDIIESTFGKFKQKINPNSTHKLTEFVFTIANFSKNFSPEETQKALETIKIKDLKNLKKPG